MQTILFIYNLKPGVTMEEYLKFSLDVDQPVTGFGPKVKSQKAFNVVEQPEGEPKYQIFEIIECETFADYVKWTEQPEMAKVQSEWTRLCDPKNLMIMAGERIEPKPR